MFVVMTLYTIDTKVWIAFQSFDQNETVVIADIVSNGDSEKVKFFNDVIERIICGYENHPLLVISVLGKRRTGKSFLLNLLATYLSWLEIEGEVCDVQILPHKYSRHVFLGWIFLENMIQVIGKLPAPFALS